MKLLTIGLAGLSAVSTYLWAEFARAFYGHAMKIAEREGIPEDERKEWAKTHAVKLVIVGLKECKRTTKK